MSRAASILSTFLPCLESDLENRTSEELTSAILPKLSGETGEDESTSFADRVWNAVNQSKAVTPRRVRPFSGGKRQDRS